MKASLRAVVLAGVVISSPAVLAIELLDAPGPGYREQKKLLEPPITAVISPRVERDIKFNMVLPPIPAPLPSIHSESPFSKPIRLFPK